MMQSHLSSLADLIQVQFDPETEQLSLDFSGVATEIVNQINNNAQAGDALLKNFIKSVETLGLKPMISNYQEFAQSICTIDPDYAFMMDTANMNFKYGTTGNDNGLGLDSISGTAGSDAIFGLEGDDSINARMGNDYVDAGPGNDTVETCLGNDTIIGGWGNDSLMGGEGHDTYIYRYGDGSDTIYDSDGDGQVVFDGISLDEVYFSAKESATAWHWEDWYAPGNFRVNFKDGSGSVDIQNLQQPILFDDGEISYAEIVNSFELLGTNNADEIYDSPYNETIWGFDGNDTITLTNSSNDIVYAGAGNDAIYYYSGKYTIYGGDGNDTIMDQCLSNGHNLLIGGAGNDLICSGGYGADSGDTLIGGTGNDYLVGGGGGDTFIVAEGDGVDTISDKLYDFAYNIDSIIFEGITLDQAKFSAQMTVNPYGNYT
jgi:Ca2+-binding RTX toxin-like protein